MLNFIQIMKSALYLGAVIALLRSSTALLSNHEFQDPHGQAIIQNESSPDSGADLAAAIEDVGGAVAKPGHSFKPNIINATLVETEQLDSSGNADSPSHHSPSPKFSIGSLNSRWAMAYVPYTDDLNCKSKNTIETDVATIARKGFTTIRLYATDCSSLKHVGAAAKSHNLKLILGIHIDDPELTLAQLQIDEIITWATGDWDLIEMIAVGNEAIFNDFCTPASLASFIASARSLLRQAGYTGPITTTEPISILYENAATLCPVIDVAAANIHPFFHSDVSAETAGKYVANQLLQLERICPGGLQAINLETGWPSRGRSNGEAVPGQLEQTLAITNIMKSAGGKSVLLGFGDDLWKDEGDFGVETSWGCTHILGGS